MYWRTPTQSSILFLQLTAFPPQQQHTTLPSLVYSFLPWNWVNWVQYPAPWDSPINPDCVKTCYPLPSIQVWLCSALCNTLFVQVLVRHWHYTELHLRKRCRLHYIYILTTFMKDAAFTTDIFYQYYIFLCHVKAQIRFWALPRYSLCTTLT